MKTFLTGAALGAAAGAALFIMLRIGEKRARDPNASSFFAFSAIKVS